MNWDTIVIGGGAAGLSAALVLGRARRRTLLVDAGRQSNLSAHGIGGFLGQDQRPPADFYAAAREQIAAYPSVEIRDGEVVGGEAGFRLELADGATETAATVLLATGMEYRYPALEGVAERWGRSVFHCPFCHGWEVRDRPLCVLDVEGSHRVGLLRAWSDDVTRVDPGRVTGLRGPGDELGALLLDDGSEIPCEGLLVPVTLHQRSPLAKQLGAEIGEPGPVVAEPVVADGMGRTSVPRLFAAGDVSVQMPNVANAVAAGSTAAAAIVAELTAGAVQVPVEGAADLRR